MLASIIAGNYKESAVNYTIDSNKNTLTINGEYGGETELTIMLLYDPEHVQLSEVNTPYKYIIENDKIGIIRIQMEQLPSSWTNTSIVQIQRDGTVESVVVSDIGLDKG